MTERLVPRPPAVVGTSTTKGPSVPGLIPMALVRLPSAWMPRLQTPHLSRTADPGIPVRAPRPRTDPSPATPTAEPPRPEAPCHRQVPPSPLASVGLLRVSCGPPPFPGFATVGTASSELSRPTPGPLDLNRRRLFTLPLRPHAACRLLQHDVTRARRRLARTPLPARHAGMASVSPAVMAEPARFPQVRGRCSARCVTPTSTTARAGGFTPT